MVEKLENHLQFKQYLMDSPVYKGGNPIQMIREKYGVEEISKLASNENPLPTSPKVVEALQTAVLNLNRYPLNSDETLREQLANYVKQGVDKTQFFTGNGGCDVLALIAQGFLREGDEAIVCPPTFPIYEITIKQMGARPVHAARKADFSYDVEAILTAVTPKTRLLYLCSPNNPTGNVLTQTEFDHLMDRLPSNIVVVADEVYWQFNTNEQMADSLAYVNQGYPIIVVHSFSKLFGLAGLRLGYAITTPQIADYLARGKRPFHINHLTLTAAHAALDDQEMIERVTAVTIAERTKMFQALTDMDGITAFPSESNFVLFKPERDSQQLTDALMQDGMIIRELSKFYLPGYCRVSIGLPEENERFLQLLQKHLR
ncbi:MAG: histidinol-phosphate transaminase [Chloroflexota bacterium]